MAKNSANTLLSKELNWKYQMLKKIRKTQYINKPIRKLLKIIIEQGAEIAKDKIPRWRVSGEAEIKLESAEFKLFSNCDDVVVDNVFYSELIDWELGQLELFGNLAEKSNFILDIGANTGVYSVISGVKNKNSEIWAFEPYYVNFERLKLNLSLNNLDNVVAIPKAVGNKSGKIMISVPGNERICDVVSADSESTNKFNPESFNYKEIEVEEVKLDDLIPDKKVDLMKIDVENFELAVFEGAMNLLRNSSPVIQCEIFVDDRRKNFYESSLKPLGYYCYMMLKNGIVFCETLQANPEGRDFLFTKKKLRNSYYLYKDKILAEELIS